MGPDRRAISTGDILHVLQIAVLLAAAGVAYAKFQDSAEQSQANAHKLDRIEHYLSSRDPEYWQRSKDY